MNQSLTTVTVIVDGHEHDGQTVAKGARIRVDEPTRAWLLEHNVIAPPADAAARPAAKETK